MNPLNSIEYVVRKTLKKKMPKPCIEIIEQYSRWLTSDEDDSYAYEGNRNNPQDKWLQLSLDIYNLIPGNRYWASTSNSDFIEIVGEIQLMVERKLKKEGLVLHKWVDHKS